MKYVFFLLLVPFIYAFPLNAQPGDQQTELMLKMQSLKNALLRKDSAGLNTLLSEDVSYGHSNGLVKKKAQLIRDVVSGEKDYKSIEPSGIEVRLYDLTGIVTMQSKVSMLFK